MFKKIAEWITGRKRSDDKHPLDYIDRKAEELHAPYKVEPAAPLAPAVTVVVETKPAEPVVVAEPAVVTAEKKPKVSKTKAGAKTKKTVAKVSKETKTVKASKAKKSTT